MNVRLIASSVILAGLTACGSPSTTSNNSNPATSSGVLNVPPVMADGQGRPGPTSGNRSGTIYNVTIPSPLASDQTIGATVFEPTQMTAGETYPLVLYAAGFGDSRETGLVPMAAQAVAFKTLVDVQQLINNGYGVLTFDHVGHGDTGGKIRVMDPDFEGANVIRVVDWAEANLDWLAYGPNFDGSEQNNLMLGSVGASYGGGYQLMLHAIDPKQRLDAMVPQLTWNDLRYSLAPNNVIKDGWVKTLADGKDDQFDPFFLEQLDRLFIENQTNPEILDTLRYHGIGYFCDGDSVNTNAGSPPLRSSSTPLPVHALFVQSARDILFNLNEAVNSYNCYKNLGGDVRLYTVQIGHNTIGTLGAIGLSPAPSDPGAVNQTTDPTSLSATCANEGIVASTLSFFDEYLKGNAGASTVSNPICLDLSATDSILADTIQRGGTRYTISNDNDRNLITIGQDDSANTTVSLFTVPALDVADVLAGIPTANITLTDEDNPNNNDHVNTIVFVGIGHKRAVGVGMGMWDLVDNQLTPLRGLGNHQVDLTGILERVNAGDEVGLMLFGKNDNQYATTGSRPENPAAARVRVTGTVEIPQLGNVPMVVQ